MGKMATLVFCIFYHIFFKNRMKEKAKSLSHVQLFVTPWTVAYQAPPSMGYSREEYWSGLPLPSPDKSAKVIKLGHNILSNERC